MGEGEKLTRFEQLLLEEVRGARQAATAAQVSAAATEATIKADREADKRFCGQCREVFQANDENLFDRIGSMEQWKSAHESAAAATEKAEIKVEDTTARRWSKAAAAFAVLGALGGIIAEWSKIKATLAAIFASPPPPGAP